MDKYQEHCGVTFDRAELKIEWFLDKQKKNSKEHLC